MKDTLNLLTFWLDAWKKQLEKPRQLIFERSFVNIARVAAAALEDTYRTDPTKKIQRSATGWGRKLLGLLEDAFTINDPVIGFLKLEYKSEIEELERQIQKPEFELAAIFPLLEKIREGLSLPVISKALVEEILRDESAEAGRIQWLSDFLLKVVLTKHGSNTLKKMPQKSLARYGSEFFLNQHLAVIMGNKQLTADLWSAVFKYWGEETIPEKIKAALKENPESLFDVFDSYLWGNLTRRLMRRITQKFADEMKTLALSSNDKINLAEAFETDEAKHKKIGLLASEIYVKAFLRALFAKVSSIPSRQEDSNLSDSLTPLSDYLYSTAKFDDRAPGRPNRRPNVVDLVSTEAFVTAAARIFSERLADNFDIENQEKIITDVGRRLCTCFGLEIRESEIDWTSAGDAEISMLCETFSARDVLHRELGLIVLSPPLDELLIMGVADVLEALNAQALSDDEELRVEFWNEWREFFSQHSAHDSHIFNYLPWETIETDDLKELLNRVFADFSQPLEEWTAVAIIPNLAANGKIWRISDITFFDAAQFDFGEKRWFVHKFSDGATFAKLNIHADTPLEAQRRAWERLNNVLNGFAFGLSLNRSFGGFKTEIHPDIYVAPVSNVGWSAGQSLARNDRPIKQTLDAFREFVAPAIEDLLDAANTSAGLNDLQNKLLHAWHWYNKGRWQPDATETIIYYWIGLEHLFGESDTRLFEPMSRLGVTWSTVYGAGWYFLERHLRDVIKMIEEDEIVKAIVETDSELTDWNKDLRVLLNHQKVAHLLTVIPNDKTSIKSYVESYRDYLQKFVDAKDDTLSEVEQRRSEYRFKLFLLKDLRNRMAHQALYYRPDIVFYAEELQEIFENLLGKIADVGLIIPPPHATVSDYIDSYEQFWVS